MAVQKSVARSSGSKKVQKDERKFIINVTEPATEKIFDIADYEKYLNERIKVDDQTCNFQDRVKITPKTGKDFGKIEIVTTADISGRYLKYLTKKYLKKQQLRDWLRIVSTGQGNYTLRYFNVANDDDENADEDDE